MSELNMYEEHCMKSVRIRSYSDPHFPASGLNTDQNNSEYEHFLFSGVRVSSLKIYSSSSSFYDNFLKIFS